VFSLCAVAALAAGFLILLVQPRPDEIPSTA
jgi:hypothetical protein